MDLQFDDADAGVPAGGARLPVVAPGCVPDQLLRHGRGFRTASPLGRGAFRRRAVGNHLAGEVRRPRRELAAVGGVRGGVLPRRRAGPGQRQRHVDARADVVRARHRRAARSHSAKDGQRQRDLGAGLVGAGVRQRPRFAALDGDPYRRRLAAQRPEDLELAGTVRRQSFWTVPFRPRGAAAQRPDLFHVRPEVRRDHGTPDRPARRRHRVR